MQTVDTLAGSYVKLTLTLLKVDAGRKWEWARDLSGMLDSLADDKQRTKTSEEIGIKIGEGLSRAAYSGTWVRQHAAAYRKFTAGLTGQDDYRAFLDACNGNSARAAKSANQSSGSSSSDSSGGETDILAKIKKDVKAALAAGITAAQIQTAVLEGLK